MALLVLFGGENLPPGKKTWYDKINPDGSYGGQEFVRHGDIRPADEIGAIEPGPNGTYRVVPAVNRYYRVGMASAILERGTDAAEEPPKP